MAIDLKQEVVPQDPYFVFEELYNANPMVLCRFVDPNLINEFFSEMEIPARLSKAIVKYEKEKCTIYFLSKEFDDTAKTIVEIFTQDLTRAAMLNEQIITTAKALIQSNNKFLQKIREEHSLSLSELVSLWKAMEGGYARLFRFTWIHNSLDFKDGLFTAHLFNFLYAFIKDNHLDINVNQAFVALTTPEKKNTYFVKLEKEIRMLKDLLQEQQIHNMQGLLEREDIGRELKRLCEEYGWLGFGFDGPSWDEAHFAQLLFTAESVKKSENISAKKQELLQSLSMGEKYEKMFELACKVIEGTELRKEAMFHYYYVLDTIFDRLSVLLHLPKKCFRYVYPDEIGSISNPDFKNILEERTQYHVDFETPNKNRRMIGAEAEDFFQGLTIESGAEAHSNEILGQSSYPGIVRGRVKIVNEKSDILKMEVGDILVSIATNPELISAMKKASAFVTDRGGITCHAAIVSRELGIPCIIGTKIATKILKDGDKVEVDANKGVVRVLLN